MSKGAIAQLEKNKKQDAEERVREREDIEVIPKSSDGRARTRNELLKQRREKNCASTASNFKSFRFGIHGGKPIPTFYANPAAKVNQNASTIEWYKHNQKATTTRAGGKEAAETADEIITQTRRKQNLRD